VEDGVFSPSSVRTPPDSRPALVQPPDDLFFHAAGPGPTFPLRSDLASAADYIRFFPSSPPILVYQPLIGLCWGRFGAAHQFPA